jgi:nitric oxide reductase NorD protein
VYPEWDYRCGAYLDPGAVVREILPPRGDDAWVEAALARHRRLIHHVKAVFGRLRPRRIDVGRQPDGGELDIAACVTAAADVRAGSTVDDRLYVASRPARHRIAIALLVDVSASTDGWVTGDRRIVDVEKEALLVVCEALEAVGDRYAILAFSGEGPGCVSLITVKRFAENLGPETRRRIAGLDADRYTRLGAAIRHASAALAHERADRPVLILLSDGKPNDVDLYEGPYGVEDSRQAVAEARRNGIHVRCLTVDREAPRYAHRIFGALGFARLSRADRLPTVLVETLRGHLCM